MRKSSIDGIQMHTGVRKLELTMDHLNNALFDDDSDVNLTTKGQMKFFKQFVADVTHFEKKVEESTSVYYDASTSAISSFIKSEIVEKEIQPISVFSPMESVGSLRTALVKCNFTDISRCITDLKRKMREEPEEDQMEQDDEEEEEEEKTTVQDIVITENAPIHTVIDSISNCTTDLCVLIVQQFESLPPQYFDSLISLIYSRDSIRPKISKIRLVICISTSQAYFTSCCSVETLNLLQIERFQFTRLNDIFDEILAINISPAIFTGEFVKYLRTRFFACDYSVPALIKAVQFAFLQKYIADPMWRNECEDHAAELRVYDEILAVFRRYLLGDEIRRIELHIDVQTKTDFWKEIEENKVFRERKCIIFENIENDNKGLQELRKELIEKMGHVDSEWCTTLDEVINEFETAVQNEANTLKSPPPASKTPSKKTSFLELQQKQKMAMEKRREDPLRKSKTKIFDHIMSLFKSIIKPYPPKWRNLIGIDNATSSKFARIALDSNDEYDIEKCLLNDAQFKNEPIAIAWRTLLTHRNFKSVPISEWAIDFQKNYKTEKDHRIEAFFAAVGQLEHMGMIRGTADKRSSNVQVLYHPVSFIPSI